MVLIASKFFLHPTFFASIEGLDEHENNMKKSQKAFVNVFDSQQPVLGKREKIPENGYMARYKKLKWKSFAWAQDNFNCTMIIYGINMQMMGFIYKDSFLNSIHHVHTHTDGVTSTQHFTARSRLCRMATVHGKPFAIREFVTSTFSSFSSASSSSLFVPLKYSCVFLRFKGCKWRHSLHCEQPHQLVSTMLKISSNTVYVHFSECLFLRKKIYIVTLYFSRFFAILLQLTCYN